MSLERGVEQMPHDLRKREADSSRHEQTHRRTGETCAVGTQSRSESGERFWRLQSAPRCVSGGGTHVRIARSTTIAAKSSAR
jgi:hypothetical protein